MGAVTKALVWEVVTPGSSSVMWNVLILPSESCAGDHIPGVGGGGKCGMQIAPWLPVDQKFRNLPPLLPTPTHTLQSVIVVLSTGPRGGLGTLLLDPALRGSLLM